MKVIINNNGGLEYRGDILFRVYPNQDLIHTATDLCDNWYAFEILRREPGISEFTGRYTSNHPQGAQNMLEKLLNEQKDYCFKVELSNEMIDHIPHQDCQDKKWFDTAFRDVISGMRKYNFLDGTSIDDPKIDTKQRTFISLDKKFPKPKNGGQTTRNVLLRFPYNNFTTGNYSFTAKKWYCYNTRDEDLEPLEWMDIPEDWIEKDWR